MRLRGCRIRGRRRRWVWAPFYLGGFGLWTGEVVISARRTFCWCGRGVPGVFLGLFCIIIRPVPTRIRVVVLHATFNLD